MGVEVVPFLTDKNELAGLVSRDQKRRTELPQERGEVGRVDRPQRRRFLNLESVRVQHRSVGESRCSHGLYLPLQKVADVHDPERKCDLHSSPVILQCENRTVIVPPAS